ncbi:MAG: hypothetical protein ACK40L_02115, partial [Hydrogenophaga sp.]
MTLDPDAHLMSLIDRVAARDEAALKALYELTSSKLYGLSLRVVRVACGTDFSAVLSHDGEVRARRHAARAAHSRLTAVA